MTRRLRGQCDTGQCRIRGVTRRYDPISSDIEIIEAPDSRIDIDDRRAVVRRTHACSTCQVERRTGWHESRFRPREKAAEYARRIDHVGHHAAGTRLILVPIRKLEGRLRHTKLVSDVFLKSHMVFVNRVDHAEPLE